MQNKEQRSSNFELLRLLAMLMIVLGHTPFFSFLNKEQIVESPLTSIFLYGYKGLTIVAVNVFVLISGWFGIRFRTEKFFSLIFQTLFFSCIVYVLLLLFDSDKYMNYESLSTIICLNSDDYWFIKAYIGLVIFAPVINKFIHSSTEKELRTVLILFYSFQTIYGWFNLYGAHWFEGGFSMISFVGLYMLARYIRLYGARLNDFKYTWLILYLGTGLFLGGLCLLLAYLNINIYGRLLTYTNPLVILSAIFVLLFISQINIKSRIINYTATFCFAMYLLHAHPLVLWPIYRDTMQSWLVNLPVLQSFIYSLLFIIAFILASIVIDLLRKYIWLRIEKRYLTRVKT